MIRIAATLSELHIDVGRYTKTLDAQMQVQTRQAARAWLRAVIPRIPVYSGAARTTFKPLGRFLKVAIPIAPSLAFKRSNRKQNPNLGWAEEQSDFSFTKEGFKYTFSFDERLFYVTLNNYFDMSGHIPLIRKTPWEAFQAGEAAFQDYVVNEMPKRFRRVEDFVHTKKVTTRWQ